MIVEERRQKVLELVNEPQFRHSGRIGRRANASESTRFAATSITGTSMG